ncbi:mechanosensitive ion channel family protein [Anaerobacillus sp. MEB173]|uniref:mechanosensitive ion channel family protein n=1 Tax=Anaerobacillus sp. MEB173 TaxID=3383345 RepID=UPI003F8DE69D
MTEIINFYNQYDQIIHLSGLALFIIFNRFLSRIVIRLISKFVKTVDNAFLNEVLSCFELPLRWFFILLPFYLGIISFDYSPSVEAVITNIYRSLLVLIFGSGFIKLSSQSSVVFEKITKKFEIDINKILIPFLSKAFQFLLFVLMFLIIAQEWNYDISGFIAGLGLGGLAVALAAQDSLKNLFSGLLIIIEKPMDLGDWIATPSVEGTVEDINFRSTKIRTFAQALVTVPNAQIASEPITNWSKMGKRRITFHLGLKMNTPKDKIEKTLKDIRELLKYHDGVHQETVFVNFDGFNDSDFGIFFYFFTNTTVWGEWLHVKEDINLKIIGILEKNEVSLAYPSQSIYVEELYKKQIKNEEKPNES